MENCESLVGAETVERIREKAVLLKDLHVVNINSTYYGGGVAELRTSVTLLMNSLGITKTGWRVIQSAPDFFTITRKMHNALQGASINVSKRKMQLYEEIIHENAVRNHLEEKLYEHGIYEQV